MGEENMRFRAATEADMPQIMRVVRDAQAFIATLGIDQWQDGYPTREILMRDIRIGQLYAIVEGEDVRGVAALQMDHEPIYDGIEGAWPCGTDAKCLTIHRLATDDAARGRGVAARMMDEAVRLARENGCACVRADTHTGNVVMRRFLEKHGFVYCGKVYYPDRGGTLLRVAYEKKL